MKKMRAVKIASVPKEEKRTSLVTIDADIHKLLTKENYKRYRDVTVRGGLRPRRAARRRARLGVRLCWRRRPRLRAHAPATCVAKLAKLPLSLWELLVLAAPPHRAPPTHFS